MLHCLLGLTHIICNFLAAKNQLTKFVVLPGTDAQTVVSETDPDVEASDAGPGVSQGEPTPSMPISEKPLPHPVPRDSLNSHSLASLVNAASHGTLLQLLLLGHNASFHSTHERAVLLFCSCTHSDLLISAHSKCTQLHFIQHVCMITDGW